MNDKPKPKSKALVPPKPQKQNTFGLVAGMSEVTSLVADNMKQTTLRDLNFKVDPDFHTRFKTTASAAGLTMKELLEESFTCWINSRKAK